MAALFAWSLWPWIIFALVLGGWAWTTYLESAIGSLVILAIGWAFGMIFYDFNALAYVFSSLPMMIAALVGFVGIGFGWASFKWRRYVKRPDNFEKVAKAKKSYLEENEGATVDDFFDSDELPYVVWLSNNKNRIMSWWVGWPISMIMYVLGDFLYEVWSKLYDMAATVFRSITKSVHS